MSVKEMLKKKLAGEKKEPKKGMGAFEEFEGSDRSHTVEQSPYSPEHYLTTKEYSVPSELVNFEDNLESFLQNFFASASPDEFNCNFLDARLKSLEETALASLKLQRNEHIRGQLKCIEDTWHVGKYDFASMIAIRKQEQEAVEREIATYTRILNSGTAFEES